MYEQSLRRGPDAAVPILPTLVELKTWDSRLNHSFLESFLEAFSEGILVFDLSGALLYVNEAVCGLLEQTVGTPEQRQLLEREIQVLYRLMVEPSMDCVGGQPLLNGIPLRSIGAEVRLAPNVQLRIHVRRFQACTHPEEMVWYALRIGTS